MTTISSPSQDLLNQTNLTGYEPGAHRRRKRYQNSQQWLPPPKPLWRQSHSSRDDNYTSWSKQIESHLKASNAWQIITGRWKKPSEPSHLEAPLRPQDLITEHRERRQQEEDAQADGRRQTQDADGRRQTQDADRRPQTQDADRRPQTQDADRRRVRRTQTAGKMCRNKAERTAINDINSRIPTPARKNWGVLMTSRVSGKDSRSIRRINLWNLGQGAQHHGQAHRGKKARRESRRVDEEGDHNG